MVVLKAVSTVGYSAGPLCEGLVIQARICIGVNSSSINTSIFPFTFGATGSIVHSSVLQVFVIFNKRLNGCFNSSGLLSGLICLKIVNLFAN